MSLFGGGPEIVLRRAQEYLLAIAQESFLDRKSQILRFDNPETAGGVLKHALDRKDYGETLHILRSAGFELHETTLKAMVRPGDVWICVLYPFRGDAYRLGAWRTTSAALHNSKRVSAVKPEIYFGGHGGLTEETWKLHSFAYQDAKEIPSSLYFLAEVGSEVG